MIRSLTLFLAGGLALLAFTGNATSAAAPRTDDAQKIVFLSDAGPILIELNVKIDGRAFRTAHRNFINTLFDYLDKNKDGVLSRSEMARAPAPQALAGPSAFFVGQGPGGKLLLNREGEFSRRQLLEHYQKSGLTPFGVSFAPRQTGVVVLNSFGAPSTASANAINARLFELLDTDRDGKLSIKELEAAPTILAKLDENEDEIITPVELQGEISGPSYGVKLAIADPRLASDTGNRAFAQIGDDGVTANLGRRLLQRYGGKDATTLSRKQINLSPNNYERLDRNEDGVLEASELDRLGVLDAEAAFTVRLGKRGEKEPIVVCRKSSKWVQAKPTANGVLLSMGNVQLELRGPEAEDTSVKVNFSPREQYITQFRNADTDNNSYLDKAEAEKSPFFRAMFAIMDEDSDGKLFEKEMLAYVDRVEQFRQQATRCCLTLTVMDDGKGLFEMIDLDGDGRLSVRELRQMPRLIKQLDKNGDSLLARTEVPRRYKGTFDLGAASNSDFTRKAVVFRLGGGMPPPPPAKLKGPVWFRKMDRNRDGDLSRAEWLGTAEEFKSIDTDGDGLISLAEAEAYDQKKRPTDE